MFCSLWLRPTQKSQTSVQPAGKRATWNESFHLPVEFVHRQKLVLVLYDHDNMRSDDELRKSAPFSSTVVFIAWLAGGDLWYSRVDTIRSWPWCCITMTALAQKMSGQVSCC